MKTRIATLMIAFGLLVSVTAFANEPVPASKAVAQSVASYIGDNLEYPEFAEKEKYECCVVAKVVIQDDGTFDVDCANCVSEEMKKYVINEIENLETEKYVQYAGQTVLVKINFDLLLV